MLSSIKILHKKSIPKVSVIVPVYNTEEYLSQCLDSVINQTLNDIEVIIIDDGSTDNSLSICRQFAEYDKRVIVLTQKNKGVSFARNRGIMVAKGQFIAFMDSDDYYSSKGVLKKLYWKAIKNNALICGGNLHILNGPSFFFEREGRFSIYEEQSFCRHYHRYIYNLSFIKQNNLFFPYLIHGQDAVFLLFVLLKAKEVYFVPDIVYEYRLGPGGGKYKYNWTAKRIAAYYKALNIRLNLLLFAQQV